MRTRASILFIIGSLALTAALVFAADNAATKALIAADADWSAAAVAHNLDKLASYYADDAHVYPPNQPAVTGRAAAKEAWSKMLRDGTVSWKTSSAGVDGKTGWTAGTYKASFKGADGRPAIENGKYLCVWHKDAKGNWKAIHDMWNTDK